MTVERWQQWAFVVLILSLAAALLLGGWGVAFNHAFGAVCG